MDDRPLKKTAASFLEARAELDRGQIEHQKLIAEYGNNRRGRRQAAAEQKKRAKPPGKPQKRRKRRKR